ncbi:MAG TPA: hypothetical protein VHJ77_19600 [Vicinamibacterales bacterium]|nr:hypothetical protein [Vicinamibacterales bacterium]
MHSPGRRAAAALLMSLVAVLVVCAQSGPRNVRPEAARADGCVLIADPRVVRSFVGTRASEMLRAPSSNLVTMSVTYSGFTPQAQAAFQHAVNLWSTQLTSPVTIRIEAQFTNLGGNVLGSAGPWLVRDYPGLMPGTWYAVGLANKLGGVDRLPGNFDIHASFNSEFDWYYGTDGNAPGGTYDFVSVVLHELGHGLGFLGAMNVSGGQGTWGNGGYPVIYDRFTENGAGQPLLGFASPSTTLAAQLTSNNLFFDGPRARAANGGAAPRLYAPSSWQQGSSYSHLNEATYGVGNPNSLMTPALSSGEAIHDPGPITRGIFEDTGWTAGPTLTTPQNLRVVR